jgi:predicted TIM-barrel fold metal-dependent hydrolase
MADEQLFFVRDRHLDYPVFDVDNHMYENTESFTKFMPGEYQGLVKYIQEGDRTRLVVKDRIERAIPNPTFQRVAPPGGQNDDPLHRRSIAGLDAFYHVEPRYKLMQEFGISRAIMWPTLGSVIEQALPEDPYAVAVAFHALNRWMEEHWTFGYENAVFTAPMISLQELASAVEELEWVAGRGARVVYLNTGPASGFGGRRSIAQPEFDPFWSLMEDSGIVAGFHQVVNRRYPVDLLEMGGGGESGRYFAPPGSGNTILTDASFRALCTPRWQVADFISSMVGHGCLARHPRLKVAIVEFFCDWIRPMIQQFQRAYERSPQLFDEDPMDALRRNVFIHAFRDTNPIELIELLGVENTMWGSDFPHPEGLRDPLAFSEEIATLPLEVQKAVMGGNLARLMGVS